MGLDIDLQNNLDNVYFKKSEGVFQMMIKFNPLLFMSILFHEIDWLLKIILTVVDAIKKALGLDSVTDYRWLNQQVDSLFKKRFEQKVN